MDLLRLVTEQYGIPLRRDREAQAQAVETLLSQLQQGLLALPQSLPAPDSTPDRTTTWFVDRIDSLEQQIERLQAERDLATADRAQLEQDLAAAQAQISGFVDRLQQLEQAQVVLDHLKHLLPQGSTAVPTPTPAPAQPIAVAVPESAPRSIEPEAAGQKPRSEKSNLGDSEDKVHYILDRIFAFNQSVDRPDQRWQISYPPVRELARILGSDNQSAIKNVFELKK